MDEKRSKWFYYLTPGLIILAVLILFITDWYECFTVNKTINNGVQAFNKGDFVTAIREFSKAQQNCESDIFSRYYLGAAYHNYGWYDEALEEYQTTWTLARENATKAMHSAGRIYYHRDNLKEAEKCFRQALSLVPSSPIIWYELGQVYLRNKNFSAALNCFREALQYDPANMQYRKVFQMVYDKINQDKQLKKTVK